ncbi:hypothetical protein HOI26_05960 [Candidatus Woesearchaeota archaeon]|nr:hypothetical protein [Candidatus Woesearchaeota archaeon]
MAKVIISNALKEEIFKKFKASSTDIFLLLKSLETQPCKGKSLGHVGKTIVKEIKWKKFRFYFITDGHMLKFGTEEELANLLIKFVKMSEKKDQQKTINEIKNILKSFGFVES